MLRSNRNIFWSGLEAVVSAAFSFASAFLVARLVGPAELGVGAAVVSAHVLLWVGVNALFADALVQRASVDAAMAASAASAGLAAGLLGALVQAAIGPLIGWSIGDPRPPAMALVLALPLPLVGAAGVAQGLLTRERDYRALARRTLIGQGLGTLAGIAAALAGAGAWALVVQQLVTSVAGALALLIRGTVRPALRWRWDAVRALLAFGLPLTGSTLVQHARYRVFALLIGGIAGPAALGQVHMAFRLVDTVRDLAITALWRLMLPAMADCQHDPPALQARLDRFLALSGLVLFPSLGAMLVTIAPLVSLLLGPVWAPASGAATVLLLLAAWMLLSFPATVAMVARGRARPALVANLASLALTAAAVALLRPDRPALAALAWAAAQVAVAPYVILVAASSLGGGALATIRAGLPALALAAVATAAAIAVPRALGEPTNAALLIAVRLLAGAAVYLPGAAALLPGTLRAALGAAGLEREPRGQCAVAFVKTDG